MWLITLLLVALVAVFTGRFTTKRLLIYIFAVSVLIIVATKVIDLQWMLPPAPPAYPVTYTVQVPC